MKHLFFTKMLMLAGSALILMIAASPTLAETYKKKVDHKGRDVTPKEAYKLLEQDPKHTFIVDTRMEARKPALDLRNETEAYIPA